MKIILHYFNGSILKVTEPENVSYHMTSYCIISYLIILYCNVSYHVISYEQYTGMVNIKYIYTICMDWLFN